MCAARPSGAACSTRLTKHACAHMGHGPRHSCVRCVTLGQTSAWVPVRRMGGLEEEEEEEVEKKSKKSKKDKKNKKK